MPRFFLQNCFSEIGRRGPDHFLNELKCNRHLIDEWHLNLFSGEYAGELSFAAGRIVKLRRYIDDEWLEGELDGKTGIFPVAYVDTIIDCPHPVDFPADVPAVRDSGEF